jgi:enamine deaminase RidA (YjgF/YER057c/UK114 family)
MRFGIPLTLLCLVFSQSAPMTSTSPTAIRAGRFIHVATVTAEDAAGRVSGDVPAQTRVVFEKLAAPLKAEGMGLERAAKVHVYLKRASDFQAMNEVYKRFLPADPPARTTIVANLPNPNADVGIGLVAIAAGEERRIIHPPDWLKSPLPYSYGVKSGDTLFLAGLVSRNGRDNSVVRGDMEAQTRATLDNAREILEAAGMTPRDVVSARVYITDTANFEAMNKAYREFFATDPPARATVRADLAGPDYLVEITLVAVQGAREAVTMPAADGSPGKKNPNLSSAIRVGNRLFVSGFLGNTEATRGDAAAQTRETVARIERTMRAAGFEPRHVVDNLVYVTDMKHHAPVDAVVRELLPHRHARTDVQSGLVAPDGLVEIMVTAIR